MTVRRYIVGDCRESMRSLDAGSARCCVTSPPYWGLRDYGNAGQIGLEETPDAYVAALVEVFREVRRVLADDGTLWLNLGDSYAREPSTNVPQTKNPRVSFPDHSTAGSSDGALGRGPRPGGRATAAGLKPKDLVGIPWMVAKALQAPLYVGKIRHEAERAWLAGWLDGEGTISFTERDRGEDHTPTHDVRVFVTNSDRVPLDYFAGLSGGNVYQHEDGTRENRFGSRPCYRWQMGTHDGALLLRELYPYLRTKRRQAALVWTLYTTLRHKNGHARTPDAVVARRREIAEMVRALNRGEDVTLPSWVEDPPSPTEPGWWLRSDIVWAKPNPMPESVTDRPTKAHEYVFLLAKSERYYYDAKAIAEPARFAGDVVKLGAKSLSRGQATGAGVAASGNGTAVSVIVADDRNARTVWTIPSQPYAGAHFATMPPALAQRCIRAGSAVGDVVLDPFGGSGTTARVAEDLGRGWVLCDLSDEYAALAAERTAQLGLLGRAVP